MRFDYTARILGAAASIDGRTVDETMIAAWAAVLPDSVLLPDALRAVGAHYQRTNKPIMPSDIIDAAGIHARRQDAIPAARILAALPAHQPMPAAVRPEWEQLRTDLEARTRAREAS